MKLSFWEDKEKNKLAGEISRNTNFPLSLIPGIVCWAEILDTKLSWKDGELYFGEGKIETDKLINAPEYLEEISGRKPL